MKKLMLGLMMAFAVSVEAVVEIDGFKYELNTQNKTATLTGYTGSPTEVNVSTIISEGETYTVTSVGANAFYDCSSLASVSLPNATTVGDNAFWRCGSLTSVSLPKATSVGAYAFFLCDKLTSVSLPNVVTIGSDAFRNCKSLTSVTLPKVVTIEGYAFQNCPLNTISLPKATSIGTYAFAFCALTSISLPNDTSVGAHAFFGCDKLTSISLPNATTIGEGAFSSCFSLTSVSLPNATTIGEDVFYDDDQLKTIYVNETMAVRLRRDRGFYGVGDDCEIFPSTVVVEPYPAEHSTVKVYANGAEVTSIPIEVVSNATVEVVFMVVEEGYCFEDHSTVQTNTVTATDDPTKVDGPTVVKIPSLGEDEVRKAEWEAEATITVSTAPKSGDKILDKGEYEYACEFYGVEVKAEPTEADFKAVSKDAQVVQEDEIAVKKESIAAPSAGTVKVEDNKVQLGVTVLKTSDLTAEKKEWGEVTLTADDVKVVDGKIVISVPVDSTSGFMILQSKDAKVNNVPNIIIEDR